MDDESFMRCRAVIDVMGVTWSLILLSSRLSQHHSSSLGWTGFI